MGEALWNEVDRYITDSLFDADPALTSALEESAAAGLPAIAVSAPLGKLLSLMARAQGARRILEIGTLGGYSAIWLARALPADGRLITLELDPRNAKVAASNVARAGFADRVDIRVGDARETLGGLAKEKGDLFDFVFIDADKTGYPQYFTLLLPLVRVGGVIIADNIVRDGAVADAASSDANVQAVRRYNAVLAAEPRVSATVVQTVGSKGYDGFSMAVVVA